MLQKKLLSKDFPPQLQTTYDRAIYDFSAYALLQVLIPTTATREANKEYLNALLRSAQEKYATCDLPMTSPREESSEQQTIRPRGPRVDAFGDEVGGGINAALVGLTALST